MLHFWVRRPRTPHSAQSSFLFIFIGSYLALPLQRLKFYDHHPSIHMCNPYHTTPFDLHTHQYSIILLWIPYTHCSLY